MNYLGKAEVTISSLQVKMIAASFGIASNIAEGTLTCQTPFLMYLYHYVILAKFMFLIF